MPPGEPSSLCLSHVSAGYARYADVLRDMTASFESGRITAIIGPNGAGKSTLARTLAGVLRPTRGDLTLNGQSLWTRSRADIARRIAYMPQRSELSEPMTVAEVVALGSFASSRDDRAAHEAMVRVGVWPLRDAMFARLSAGQQQRVTLARTLVQLNAGSKHASEREQFLIADEPVSAQDPKQIGLVMRCLREEAMRGRGVVVVLHDLTLAARHADHAVALAESGRIAASGLSDVVLGPEVLETVFGVKFRRLVLGGTGTASASAGSVAIIAEDA